MAQIQPQEGQTRYLVPSLLDDHLSISMAAAAM